MQSFCEESFVLLWTNRTKCVKQKSPPRKSQPLLNSCCQQENAVHILRRLSSVCACNRAKIAKKERSACVVPPIIWTSELLGVFLLSKLTHQQKLEIYAKRKAGYTISHLSLEYGINEKGIRYLCRLIDHHGPDILRQDKNRYYSPELKVQIINSVLIDHQSVYSVAIEYGLPNDGLLHAWIRSYKDNGYVIIEKNRGRPSSMKQHPKPIIKAYEDMTPEEKVKYLEEKNLYLEAENAYLKKLRAVVQQRKEREQKKK